MERIDYNPAIWGPKGWFLIDTILRSLPDEIDKKLEKEVKDYLLSTSKLLPCQICRNHMDEHIVKTNMMSLDFSKKNNVLTWFNDLHNLRLGKKSRSLETVNKYYENIYRDTTYYDMFILFIFIAIGFLYIKYHKNIQWNKLINFQFY